MPGFVPTVPSKYERALIVALISCWNLLQILCHVYLQLQYFFNRYLPNGTLFWSGQQGVILFCIWTLFTYTHVQVRISVLGCDCQLSSSSTVIAGVALLAEEKSFVLNLQGFSTETCNACFTQACLGLPGALFILVLAITATFLMPISNLFYFSSYGAAML